MGRVDKSEIIPILLKARGSLWQSMPLPKGMCACNSKQGGLTFVFELPARKHSWFGSWHRLVADMLLSDSHTKHICFSSIFEVDNLSSPFLKFRWLTKHVYFPDLLDMTCLSASVTLRRYVSDRLVSSSILRIDCIIESPADIACVHTNSLTEIVTAEIHFAEDTSLMVSVVINASWVYRLFSSQSQVVFLSSPSTF